MSNIQVASNPAAVAIACADHLHRLIQDALRRQDRCHIILPGGTTPVACLQQLAAKPLPWGQLHWYPSDERCLPVGHPDRNDRMLRSVLPAAANLHSIPAELGPEQGAAGYAMTLAELMASQNSFDIALLGMGEDGHTASLFPDNPALEDARIVVPVRNAPKPPPDRISMGVSVLSQSREKIVLASGQNKRQALHKALLGETLPISRLQPHNWFLDLAIYYDNG